MLAWLAGYGARMREQLVDAKGALDKAITGLRLAPAPDSYLTTDGARLPPEGGA